MTPEPRRPMARKTRAEERIEELDVSPTALIAELDETKAARDEALAKADEYLTALQRELQAPDRRGA